MKNPHGEHCFCFWCCQLVLSWTGGGNPPSNWRPKKWKKDMEEALKTTTPVSAEAYREIKKQNGSPVLLEDLK